MRKCSICKNEYPLDAEHFFRDKCEVGGFKYLCKECSKDKSKLYRLSERGRAIIYNGHKKWLKDNEHRLFGYGKRSRDKLSEKKKRVAAKVRYAKKIGKIVSIPCEICGDVKSMGHHEDYDKPLDLIWLCQLHHSWVHNGFFSLLPKGEQIGAR